MRIIPAIDILDGKCVRLTKGDYSTSKIYNEDPVEVAKAFEDAGVTYLHMVDLDGARSSHIVNSGVLEAVSTATKLRIDFGGGVKTEEDLRIAFESGAHQVTGGSIAAKEPEKFISWIHKYGPEKIILGADAHKEKIAVNGWNEASDLNLIPYVIGYLEKGINYVICTDISKDGMLKGPSNELYKRMLSEVNQREMNMSLIASGGISEVSDLEKLKSAGCEGAILGKAIYENKISLAALEKWILAHGN